MSHPRARRGLVDVTANFPEECRYVLESLRDIYRLDSQAKEQNLCQSNDSSSISATIQPVMEKLHTWLDTQIEQKQEPNSGLGKAIAYMLGHWERLTLFLREAGAPLG